MLTIILLIAQTCVAEIGFQGQVEECLTLTSISINSAKLRGRSLNEQILKYHSAWRFPKQQKRKWLYGLNSQATQPKNWPANLNWENYRVKWQSLLVSISNWYQAYTEGKPVLLCQKATDYGGPMDQPKNPKAKRVFCGKNFRQVYWRLF